MVDWVDIFTRKIYKDIVISSLEYCIKEKGMILYGYVIMSNHIHFIIQSKESKLSDLVRDFKKFTAKNQRRSVFSDPKNGDYRKIGGGVFKGPVSKIERILGSHLNQNK